MSERIVEAAYRAGMGALEAVTMADVEINRLNAELTALRAQRDELAAAAKAALYVIGPMSPTTPGAINAFWALRAALAKLTEEVRA